MKFAQPFIQSHGFAPDRLHVGDSIGPLESYSIDT